MPLELSAATLRRMWPGARQSIIDGTVAAWPAVRDHYAINTPRRAAHFWAQISWECGCGSELRESGHYSADAIVATFGVGHHSAKVTRPEAERLAALARKDGGRALFNRVYGVGNPKKAAELGNTEPDDGWNFRGFGALNSTGRAAAVKIGAAIGQDLAGNPDLCNDPGIALWAGAEEYVSLGCLALADADDLERETRRINGGTNGLSGRAAALGQWRKVFVETGTDGASPIPAGAPALTPFEIRAIQTELIGLGYAQVGRADGAWGVRTTSAVAALQAAAGLPVTGAYDDATRDALARGVKAPVSDTRATATKADIAANPVAAQAKADKSTAVATGAVGLFGIAKSIAGDGDIVDQAQHVSDKASQAWGLAGPVVDWAMAHPGALGAAAVVALAGWWWARAHGVEGQILELFRQGKAEG